MGEGCATMPVLDGAWETGKEGLKTGGRRTGTEGIGPNGVGPGAPCQGMGPRGTGALKGAGAGWLTGPGAGWDGAGVGTGEERASPGKGSARSR